MSTPTAWAGGGEGGLLIKSVANFLQFFLASPAEKSQSPYSEFTAEQSASLKRYFFQEFKRKLPWDKHKHLVNI